MTRRQIPVNGDKELIEKLNLRIKEIKSGEKPETETETVAVTENAPKVEETELIPTEVCDVLETFEKCKAPEKEVDFSKVESDRQRNIKYRRDYRKTPENEVHAVAYPTVAEMNEQSEEVKAMLEAFGPEMVRLLSRINDAAEDTTICDNTDCRKTINKEYPSYIPYDNNGDTVKASDEFKKILNTSKELVKYLKGINVDGVAGRNIRDVLTKAKAKTVKEACETVASQQAEHQQAEPEQREPETTNVPQEEKYEMVNHPAHYNNYDKEVIDIIEVIWGTQIAAVWCEITAFKYRMRMGTKPTSSVSEDLEKESWYLKKMRELNAKYDAGFGIYPKI